MYAYVQTQILQMSQTGQVKTAGSVLSAGTYWCLEELRPLGATVSSFLKAGAPPINSCAVYCVKNEEILISLLLETLTFPGKI